MRGPFLLWAKPEVNGRSLGSVEIKRLNHLDDSDPEAVRDIVAPYTVWRDGRLVGTVKHRHGDGEWVLFSLAVDLIAAGWEAGPAELAVPTPEEAP